MNAADFRRIALSLEGVEEYPHAGSPAFRVGGRKFASLASQAKGYGNLMLTLEQQAVFRGGGARDFPADSGRLGEDGGTHTYPPRGGQRGCACGCASNRVETTSGYERKETSEESDARSAADSQIELGSDD